MCDLSSIKLLVLVLSYLKALMAIYIFAAGIIVSESSDILKGLGVVFIDYGINLVLLGLLSGLVIIPMRFGTARHNRFLLVFSFVFDTICFACLLALASEMATYLIPHFPKDLQVDCLRTGSLLYTPEECAPYFQSERVAGMRLVWSSYYSNKKDKTQNQVLSQLEASCCGFFAPSGCIPNENSFPSDRDTEGIRSVYLEQRVKCGAYKTFYPEQGDCISYYDFPAGTYSLL